MKPTGWQPECTSLFPLRTHELLLRAAFADGPTTREVFATWKKQTSFANYSDIDFPSSRLLPAIYHNFQRHGIEDAWLPQMAALHRYHWMRNALTQNRILEATQALRQAGCECIVLGDFALAAGRYFDDPGERPLLDAELLISVSDAGKARRTLAELGWRDAATTPAPVVGWRSQWWTCQSGQSLRIHFRWLPKMFPVVRIDCLLGRSEQAELGGVSLRIGDPADLLVYSCIANRRPAADLSHRFLWAFRALRILERGVARLDWERLWAESRELCTLFPLRDALTYLATTFDAAVPEWWLAAARSAKLRPADRRPFYRTTRQWARYVRSLGGSVVTWPWSDYAASEEVAARKPSLAAFANYWWWRGRSELTRLISARPSDGANNRRETTSLRRAA